jgi:branched-chain amino acid transport system permease protein
MIDYIVALATLVGIQALLTLGLNFHFGLTGIVNFGQVAFYGIGAYASAILSVAGWPAPFAMLAGVAICVLASSLLGLTTLRLREDYFAILTLGFSEVLRILALNWRDLTNGAFGIPGIPRPFESYIVPASYGLFYLALVTVLLVVAFALCRVLALSPFGRTLRAIKDDDQAAMSFGKNPLRFRLLSLIWGASLASVAGSLWAHYITFVVPDQFTPEVTFYAWMAMIIGGLGSMPGSIAGAAVMVVLLEGTRFGNDLIPFLDAPRMAAIRQIFIGLGLIALMVRASRRAWIGQQTAPST